MTLDAERASVVTSTVNVKCVCGVVYPLLKQKVVRGFVRCSQASEIHRAKLQCAQELLYIGFYFAFYLLHTKMAVQTGHITIKT